jgi:hypothetical protein
VTLTLTLNDYSTAQFGTYHDVPVVVANVSPLVDDALSCAGAVE